MKKANIVRKKEDFSEIIEHGKCVKNDCFVIYYKDSKDSFAHFGISVGTKVGKAHVRNKLKRQMRNIVDNFQNSYEKSKDYIIIVRKSCLEKSFQEMEKSYQQLFRKINSEEGRIHENKEK